MNVQAKSRSPSIPSNSCLRPGLRRRKAEGWDGADAGPRLAKSVGAERESSGLGQETRRVSVPCQNKGKERDLDWLLAEIGSRNRHRKERRLLGWPTGAQPGELSRAPVWEVVTTPATLAGDNDSTADVG